MIVRKGGDDAICARERDRSRTSCPRPPRRRSRSPAPKSRSYPSLQEVPRRRLGQLVSSPPPTSTKPDAPINLSAPTLPSKASCPVASEQRGGVGKAELGGEDGIDRPNGGS